MKPVDFESLTKGQYNRWADQRMQEALRASYFLDKFAPPEPPPPTRWQRLKAWLKEFLSH